jgi:hypothetical protein
MRRRLVRTTLVTLVLATAPGVVFYRSFYRDEKRAGTHQDSSPFQGDPTGSLRNLVLAEFDFSTSKASRSQTASPCPAIFLKLGMGKTAF